MVVAKQCEVVVDVSRITVPGMEHSDYKTIHLASLFKQQGIYTLHILCWSIDIKIFLLKRITPVHCLQSPGRRLLCFQGFHSRPLYSSIVISPFPSHH